MKKWRGNLNCIFSAVTEIFEAINMIAFFCSCSGLYVVIFFLFCHAEPVEGRTNKKKYIHCYPAAHQLYIFFPHGLYDINSILIVVEKLPNENGIVRLRVLLKLTIFE